MNPLTVKAFAAIFRWILSFGSGFLVTKGVWSDADATEYVGAAALGSVSLLWSLWEKYKSRLKFIAALESPAGASEASVDTRAKTASVKAQAFSDTL